MMKEVGWQTEHQRLLRLHQQYGDPAACRSAPLPEIFRALSEAEKFARKWTQRGRVGRLTREHQAVHWAIQFAICVGIVVLWRQTTEQSFEPAIWKRLVDLSWWHLRHVQSRVCDFHIARYGVLRLVRGLLSLAELHKRHPIVADQVDALKAEYGRALHVVRVYDQDSDSSEPCNADMLESIAGDPEKLSTFYQIDPAASLEEKMRIMERLVGQEDAGCQRPRRSQGRHSWTHVKPQPREQVSVHQRGGTDQNSLNDLD